MKTIGSMQNPWDSIPISSGTLTTELGLTTIWTPWSNESDANLEDSACTARMLLLFPTISFERVLLLGQN